MTEQNSADVPESADPALLERSEQLIADAKGASHEALADTKDDPGSDDTGAGEELPVPG